MHEFSSIHQSASMCRPVNAQLASPNRLRLGAFKIINLFMVCLSPGVSCRTVSLITSTGAARSVARMARGAASGEMRAKCLLLTVAARLVSSTEPGQHRDGTADADAGSLDLKITYSGLEFCRT